MDDQRQSAVPVLLRVLVRIDFVMAVLLTVIAPLLLLVRAVRDRQQALLSTLLSYWRASSLLMVAVYLMIGQRPAAFVCGIGARLLIPWTLRHTPAGADARYQRWQRAINVYCLLGAALNLPTLRCVWTGQLSPLCRAYIEPAQEFGALLHPGVPREQLGRVGALGLRCFVAGAALLGVRRLVRGRL